MVEWREEGGKVLQKYFEELTDKRQGWKIKHNLLEIVVVALTQRCCVLRFLTVFRSKTYSQFCFKLAGN